jgi:4-amino-4-deoxy-L-arabinose transferase-like glycosyltransferase
VIIFLTMPFAYLAAQYANMDMLLAGCMCACTTCAFIATIESDLGKRGIPGSRQRVFLRVSAFSPKGSLA